MGKGVRNTAWSFGCRSRSDRQRSEPLEIAGERLGVRASARLPRNDVRGATSRRGVSAQFGGQWQHAEPPGPRSAQPMGPVPTVELSRSLRAGGCLEALRRRSRNPIRGAGRSRLAPASRRPALPSLPAPALAGRSLQLELRVVRGLRPYSPLSKKQKGHPPFLGDGPWLTSVVLAGYITRSLSASEGRRC